MQAQSVTQVSPNNVVFTVPCTGGLDTAAHDVPFHSSAKGTGEGPDVGIWFPMALQDVALKQSTPRKTAFPPLGWGTPGSIVHCVPFQLSIKFRFGLPALTPTAWHHEPPTHDTA
jgi:hypothetical protein